MKIRFGFVMKYRLLPLAVAVLVFLINNHALAGQAQFNHELIKFKLPAGWSVNNAAAVNNELIGTLHSQSIPGASILIYSYRGIKINYNNVRIRGLKSIAQTYPKGQKELKKPYTIRTDSGYKPKFELWQGFIDAGGTVVVLQSPMAAFRATKSYILMIGYVADTNGAKMEEDFIKILKSAE